LPDDLKAIIKYSAKSANQEMLDEYTARNNKALTELIEKHNVYLQKLHIVFLLSLKR
jgi:TRAP-type mannitol/chloroaromatic compound transport system, periplasmic component